MDLFDPFAEFVVTKRRKGAVLKGIEFSFEFLERKSCRAGTSFCRADFA